MTHPASEPDDLQLSGAVDQARHLLTMHEQLTIDGSPATEQLVAALREAYAAFEPMADLGVSPVCAVRLSDRAPRRTPLGSYAGCVPDR